MVLQGMKYMRDLSSNNIEYTRMATVSSDVLTFTECGFNERNYLPLRAQSYPKSGETMASVFSVAVRSTPGGARPFYMGIKMVPEVSTTIRGAIDISIDGDAILVAEGTYNENLTLLDKKLRLASHYLATGDTSKISNTVLSIHASENDAWCFSDRIQFK